MVVGLVMCVVRVSTTVVKVVVTSVVLSEGEAEEAGVAAALGVLELGAPLEPVTVRLVVQGQSVMVRVVGSVTV